MDGAKNKAGNKADYLEKLGRRVRVVPDEPAPAPAPAVNHSMVEAPPAAPMPQKQRGRPAKEDRKSEPFQVRLPPDLIKGLEEYRATQRPIPPRNTVIELAVQEFLACRKASN